MIEISPSIYVSKEVLEDLKKFIESSRLSPVFGSPKRFKSPNQAIEFLLKIGIKYPLDALDILAKPLAEGVMTEEEYDNPELKKKIVNKSVRLAEGLTLEVLRLCMRYKRCNECKRVMPRGMKRQKLNICPLCRPDPRKRREDFLKWYDEKGVELEPILPNPVPRIVDVKRMLRECLENRK